MTQLTISTSATTSITLDQLKNELLPLFKEDRRPSYSKNHVKVIQSWTGPKGIKLFLFDAGADLGDNNHTNLMLEASYQSFGFNISYSGWPNKTIAWAKHFIDSFDFLSEYFEDGFLPDSFVKVEK